MKRIIYGFMLLLVCFCPLKVNAQYLPPVLPDSSTISPFLHTVAQYHFAEETSVFSRLPENYDFINTVANGRTIQESMTEVYLDNANLLDDIIIVYDRQGNVIPRSETFTAFGSSDVGAYSYIADKNTGEILAIEDPTNDGVYISSLQSGGLYESYPEFVLQELTNLGAPTLRNQDFIMDTLEDSIHDNYIVCNDTVTREEKEFMGSYDYYMILKSSLGWNVYIPNGCTPDTLVTPIDNSIFEYHGEIPHDYYMYGSSPQFFTNDLGSVIFSGSGFMIGMDTAGADVYGQHFNYRCAYYNAFNPLGNGVYLDFKAPTYEEYSHYLDLYSDGVIYVEPVVNEGDTNNYYNYTYVTENPVSYVREPNSNFNPDNDVTPNNFPITNNFTMPNYETENNYINNIYNYYTTPNPDGGDIGSITDPILPENIPILSNLEYRFPFSIPFDIYKLLKGLNVPRETPIIDTTVIIPRIDYEWNIYYDMSPFDDTAKLFRTLFLISYIIGLAYFSYDHFFGT